MSAPQIWLLGNVGAEEQSGASTHPHARAVARLLALSLPADATLWTDRHEAVRDFWPAALGPPADGPAFPWLAAPDHAWLPTVAAQQRFAAAGRGPLQPAPEVIAAVHDKAFAQRVCNRERLGPRALRGLELVLDPEMLAAPDLVERLQQHLDAWPAWAGGRFALKPRLGSSGRGRVPGQAGRVDAETVRGAAPRLAAQGGAILEPWLERTGDFSVQLHLSPAGDVTLIGTLTQLMSAAGVYRGHLGRVDHRGRVTSGSDWDDALLAAAMELAGAAAAERFHGPCGIDAFAFEGPEGVLLRPAVELNARFTTGTLVVGLVRRALPRVAPEIGLAPGAPRFFHFALDAPAAGWPASAPGELCVLRLAPALEGSGTALDPALVFARDSESLRAGLGM